ncbi:uncharacterized protein LOC126886315 [Diabrotica virgifera virgifera]|uniref:Tc1-like transposase DDE domain-containing protein n=1 Tax=Diabrotica virgifera virgifera TaxID=50390 RepID=A0ABM5KG29_DIAVI|nr:uncharacterized protein LOC126886315 [Diabrotica virgifera virgifera]
MWRPWENSALEIVENNEIEIVEENEEILPPNNPENAAGPSTGSIKKPERKHLFKEIVLNVFNGLCEELERHESVLKTAALTKVSCATLYRIIKEGITNRQKRSDFGLHRSIEQHLLGPISETIYNMFAGNIIPTLNQILAKLKSKNIINCCKSTLRKFLLSNGFKYKTINKRHTIMESARLIKWRNEYLEKITEYRNSGRKIYYLDETWFDTNETIIGKGWSNDNVKCKVNVPPSRGKRICILHCGGEDGWVTDSLLLSAKDIKDSCLDYHQDITGELLESWFKNNLLPNLADNSVIVLDNASYHSRQLKKIPNKYSRKDELQDFLLSQDLYFEDWYTKDQLVEVLNTKLFVKEYIIDNAASKNGHTTLRLPPYYCVLNPIELLWS